MDLFKSYTQPMATAFDWNCKSICKRHKGDTQKIHKTARKKLKYFDYKVLTNLLNNDKI